MVPKGPTMKLLKTLAISALSVALGVSLMLAPAFADRVVTYTLVEAGRTNITEVQIVRDNGGVKLTATYALLDDEGEERPSDFGNAVAVELSGPQLATVLAVIDDLVIPAINEQEGL